MEAYLDNSATTRCSAKAAEMVMKVMREDFGNPSALHTKGVEAEHYVKEARAFFAKNLKVDEKEICFTSGGTESNNLALIGTAMANRRAGNHLITTSVGHACPDTCASWKITLAPLAESSLITLDTAFSFPGIGLELKITVSPGIIWTLLCRF